jgi:hypothetical protein
MLDLMPKRVVIRLFNAKLKGDSSPNWDPFSNNCSDFQIDGELKAFFFFDKCLDN